MEKVELSVELVNKLLVYLSKKPYDEVFLLIAEIQKQAINADNADK